MDYRERDVLFRLAKEQRVLVTEKDRIKFYRGNLSLLRAQAETECLKNWKEYRAIIYWRKTSIIPFAGTSLTQSEASTLL